MNEQPRWQQAFPIEWFEDEAVSRRELVKFIVLTGAASFVAYDQQCTHLQCPVVAKVAEGKLHCPCHNGWFDLQSGRPLAGPPRRPLPKVLLEVKDGAVYATGVEEKTT